MSESVHLTTQQLETGLGPIRESPTESGTLEMIVRRPVTEQREVIEEGELDLREGLLGDNWRARGSKDTDDGSAHPEMQLNIMNARTAELIAGDRSRWPLAGDQLYLDLDLSGSNLPPGSRIRIGEAVVEVTAEPHRGCRKFMERFGKDALRIVNSTDGVALNLRGINAKVVEPGTIRVGDVAAKL